MIEDIFEHWKRVMGKDRAKLTPGRKRAIQARIKEGYTKEDIQDAIDGCAAIPYNMGDNPSRKQYNDLTLICRSGEKLEYYMAGQVTITGGPGGSGNGPGKLSKAHAAEQATEDVLSIIESEEAHDPFVGANDSTVQGPMDEPRRINNDRCERGRAEIQQELFVVVREN